jgi:hypothetical protein
MMNFASKSFNPRIFNIIDTIGTNLGDYRFVYSLFFFNLFSLTSNHLTSSRSQKGKKEEGTAETPMCIGNLGPFQRR